MSRVVPALAAALALAAAAFAAPQAGPAMTVTINPEGRVGVVLGTDVPTGGARGVPIEFRVLVINQGFSTGRLEARLVGKPAPAARLEFQPQPLRGIPRESRTLWITLGGAEPVDVTIAFQLQDGDADLGGRDRVHLLLRPRA
ncbi:MAG TPA: hypothetical protein VGG37_04445 [Opitutaceae bacterium]